MAMQINEQNFEALKAEGKLMVVDFWATWCGPCKMIAPVIDELATEYDGRAVIGKVDVDESSELAARFNVRNIPTVLFIKNGEVVKKLVGAQSKDVFKKEIDELI